MVEPNLSYISLPDYYTRLLRANMQDTDNKFDHLVEYIIANPGLHALVARCFKDIDEKCRLKTIIQSIGWYGFRDRMAAIFLEYQLSGHFPLSPNLELCHELLELEHSVKSQGVEGYSRAFLMGFYWKLHRYKDKNSFVESYNWQEVLSLFKHTKAKVVKIDWLLFIMMHLYSYLGKEVLREKLKTGPNYKELYNLLTEHQKKQYIKNSLSYGASINEAEFFYQSRI